MDKQVRNMITHWWNDTMRKDWRTALADPVERNRRLDELGDEIVRHLTSRSSRAAGSCPHCGDSIPVNTITWAPYNRGHEPPPA